MPPRNSCIQVSTVCAESLSNWLTVILLLSSHTSCIRNPALQYLMYCRRSREHRGGRGEGRLGFHICLAPLCWRGFGLLLHYDFSVSPLSPPLLLFFSLFLYFDFSAIIFSSVISPRLAAAFHFFVFHLPIYAKHTLLLFTVLKQSKLQLCVRQKQAKELLVAVQGKCS